MSNPSILRLSAQNLTFSPSDTASLLLCGARTRGSEALAPSVDSPQIPRASALVHLFHKAFNPRLLSPSSQSPSNPVCASLVNSLLQTGSLGDTASRKRPAGAFSLANPSDPARKRACSPLPQSVQPSVTFSFVPVPVESRLRVARKLTPSNGFFGRHRFTGKIWNGTARGTPFLFPDPSLLRFGYIAYLFSIVLCVLLFYT